MTLPAHRDDNGATHQFDIYDCEPDDPYEDDLDTWFRDRVKVAFLCCTVPFLMGAGAVLVAVL